MSPRIAYWTSAFEPEMEAVASEVATLRRRFPASVAWGLSPRHRARVSWRRGVFCLHPRLHLIFRAMTRILEPVFNLNHIFGSLGDWFYLRGPRRRPTVLTMAVLSDPVHPSLLEQVDRFVVEYPAGRGYLERLGINPRQIRLIFPPVDLRRFSPAALPDGPFTVLFASSPESERWLETRGIPLLLEAAALRPEMRFRLLWRPWGDALPTVRRWIAQRGLENVQLVVGRAVDMPSHYRAAHVTAAPFAQVEHCKPMPNSLVESLACGRPILTVLGSGMAELVEEGRAGVVVPARGLDLAEGLDQLRDRWHAYSAAARRLAERWFAEEDFLGGYQSIYQEML